MIKNTLLIFFSVVVLVSCNSVKSTIGIRDSNGDDTAAASAVSTPKDLSVIEVTDSSIQFSWVNTAADLAFITIEKCSGGGCTDFVEVPRSPYGPAATMHTETGLSENTTYRFRMRVTSSTGGKSDYLTGTDITTLLVPNTSLAINGSTTSSISISWVINEPAAATQVQRCNGSGCTNFADTFSSPLAVGVNKYTESGLEQAAIYRFRVRAVKAGGTSKWLTTPDISTLPNIAPVTAASCSSPTTKVIDSGTKGNTTAVGRGLWSDTKIIPGTQSPATAYYDGSVTGGLASLKISYWDGKKFNVEQVAGDTFVAAGSATWVKLDFLKVGANAKRPIVVWTTGATTVKVAMRSSALGTEGIWTAAVLDPVGVATRAASISVSPADHVAIAYATSAVAAGKIRFIYCEAPCTSIAGFTTMTAAGDAVEASTQAANIQGIGTAWCKFDATTYYPAVVYHGNSAASVRYAVCASANLSNCKTAAGWTPTTIAANGAPVHMQMLIDSSVIGDVVKVLVKPAAGTALTTYTSSGSCANPTSFTAGTNVIGATTSGTSWATLMKDAGGLYHVIANNSTTSVVYMNSNSSNFQSTTWNAAGTIETATLPGLAAGIGGADIATDYGMIFTSYGLAATPFNINMGVVNDITLPSNNAAAIYYNVLPDTTGGINLPLVAGRKTRNVAAASTSDSKTGVAYVDFSNGTLTGGRLKYAYRNGTSSTTPWSISILPNVSSPLFPALAYDHNNLPWISFYDSNNYRFYLATNSASDGSGDWTIYQAPLGAKTATATAPATDDTAVAMFYNNGVAQPVLIFLNGTAAGGGGVRAVRLDPMTGQFGSMITVDAMTATSGTRLSADFDLSGNIVIAYYDLSTTTVKFNFSTNGGATWKPSSVQLSAAGVGRQGISIKINPATLRPAISYYDAASNAVYLQQCTTALSSCYNVGNWTSTVAQSTLSVGVSGVTATTQEQMLNTSLTYSGSGTPYISYMTGIGPSGISPSLALTDAASGFAPTLPTILTSVGSTASLLGTSPVFNGLPGANVSSVRNALGQLISVHVGPNNWLYATSCGD